jgi:IS1 family transposase
VLPKAKGRLAVQVDELGSFVDNKGDKQWVWLALDVVTPEIVACQIADRSADSALALWQSMPAVYRQCALIYTDDGEADKAVLASKRHWAVGKETGRSTCVNPSQVLSLDHRGWKANR